MGEPALRSATNLSLVLGPILMFQGRRLRRTIPRLPEASGPCTGLVPGASPSLASPTLASPPLNLLLIGESTAAGVGAAEHSEALVGQLAHATAARTDRAVAWQVLGRSGATARRARSMLLESELEFTPDVVVLALGVNDVLQLHSASVWRTELRELVSAVRERCGSVPVVFAAVPPMGRFPALPQPLRAVLGLRARLLDRNAQRLASELEGVFHSGAVELAPNQATALFCADRFHPSPAGYRLWAKHLSAVVETACGCRPSAV
jgi:lysophospholipase L1-like esterase